ncbi:hypothetical protein BKI52_28520 [marine bacterium AO1-C]|nr:hypothetical protein BKI52_28520 [marine bacterium AO1-C]
MSSNPNKSQEDFDTVDNLLKLLVNDDTALETAREHLEIDTEKSKAFQPELKVKKNSPLNDSTATKGAIGFFNARSRRYRHRLFEKRMRRNPDSFVIVSEGDSWFQYPVFVKDVIDHLNEIDEFAIRSFGFGGDWLSNILEESEYINAIRWYNPKVFLISGGGNDIIGDNRLRVLLKRFDSTQADRAPANYLNEAFEKGMQDLEFLYDRLFQRLTSEFPKLHIICHGYDYGLPGKEKPLVTGDWLENPMQDLGIEDKTLQRLIVKELIDRFNVMLSGLIQAKYANKNIHYLDCRGIVKDHEWYDELHPNSFGFLKVAEKFKQKIFEIRIKEGV